MLRPAATLNSSQAAKASENRNTHNPNRTERPARSNRPLRRHPAKKSGKATIVWSLV